MYNVDVKFRHGYKRLLFKGRLFLFSQREIKVQIAIVVLFFPRIIPDF